MGLKPRSFRTTFLTFKHLVKILEISNLDLQIDFNCSHTPNIHSIDTDLIE
jgi:hypothetical protein